MVSDARARRAVRGGVRVGGWGSSGEVGLEHWGGSAEALPGRGAVRRHHAPRPELAKRRVKGSVFNSLVRSSRPHCAERKEQSALGTTPPHPTRGVRDAGRLRVQALSLWETSTNHLEPCCQGRGHRMRSQVPFPSCTSRAQDHSRLPPSPGETVPSPDRSDGREHRPAGRS